MTLTRTGYTSNTGVSSLTPVDTLLIDNLNDHILLDIPNSGIIADKAILYKTSSGQLVTGDIPAQGNSSLTQTEQNTLDELINSQIINVTSGINGAGSLLYYNSSNGNVSHAAAQPELSTQQTDKVDDLVSLIIQDVQTETNDYVLQINASTGSLSKNVLPYQLLQNEHIKVQELNTNVIKDLPLGINGANSIVYYNSVNGNLSHYSAQNELSGTQKQSVIDLTDKKITNLTSAIGTHLVSVDVDGLLTKSPLVTNELNATEHTAVDDLVLKRIPGLPTSTNDFVMQINASTGQLTKDVLPYQLLQNEHIKVQELNTNIIKDLPLGINGANSIIYYNSVNGNLSHYAAQNELSGTQTDKINELILNQITGLTNSGTLTNHIGIDSATGDLRLVDIISGGGDQLTSGELTKVQELTATNTISNVNIADGDYEMRISNTGVVSKQSIHSDQLTAGQVTDVSNLSTGIIQNIPNSGSPDHVLYYNTSTKQVNSGVAQAELTGAQTTKLVNISAQNASGSTNCLYGDLTEAKSDHTASGITAIGVDSCTGSNLPASFVTALGSKAAHDRAANDTTCIGYRSGEYFPKSESTSIGSLTNLNQGAIGSTCVGYKATTKGDYSIAIGNNSNTRSSDNNTIILNSSGSLLQSAKSGATYISNMNDTDDTHTKQLVYNDTTKEVMLEPRMPTLSTEIITTTHSPTASVDVFTYLSNAAITTKNFVMAGDTMTVTSNNFNNMIIQPKKISDGEYVQWKYVSGSNTALGPFVGFVDFETFINYTDDVSDWVDKKELFENGIAIKLSSSTADIHVDGLSVSQAAATSTNLISGDFIQVGVNGDIVEICIRSITNGDDHGRSTVVYKTLKFKDRQVDYPGSYGYTQWPPLADARGLSAGYVGSSLPLLALCL